MFRKSIYEPADDIGQKLCTLYSSKVIDKTEPNVYI